MLFTTPRRVRSVSCAWERLAAQQYADGEAAANEALRASRQSPNSVRVCGRKYNDDGGGGGGGGGGQGQPRTIIEHQNRDIKRCTRDGGVRASRALAPVHRPRKTKSEPKSKAPIRSRAGQRSAGSWDRTDNRGARTRP